ncbi:hypothetical protein [Halorubrum sp. 48-1-W]|uniref:hypothetical protein n=1 Tax=Halorubrum sp. 48-1-W TaxID=2249761 RepID=UPI001300451B
MASTVAGVGARTTKRAPFGKGPVGVNAPAGDDAAAELRGDVVVDDGLDPDVPPVRASDPVCDPPIGGDRGEGVRDVVTVVRVDVLEEVAPAIVPRSSPRSAGMDGPANSTSPSTATAATNRSGALGSVLPASGSLDTTVSVPFVGVRSVGSGRSSSRDPEPSASALDAVPRANRRLEGHGSIYREYRREPTTSVGGGGQSSGVRID